MYCYKCGKRIEDDALFCGYCGARQPQDMPENETDGWTNGKEYESERQYWYAEKRRGFQGYDIDPADEDDEEESRGMGKFPVLLIVLFVVLFLVAAALVYLLAGKSGSGSRTNPGSGAQSGAAAESETLLVGEGETEQPQKETVQTERTVGAGETSTEEQKETETEKPVVSQPTYRVIVGDYSWTEADAWCREQGGHLAVITSEEEQRRVEAAVEAAGNTLHVLWLGASDLSTADGSFAWITGEAMTYTNWAPGEPSGTDGAEHYLVMYRSENSWKWNDVPDEIAMYYSGDMGFVMELE